MDLMRTLRQAAQRVTSSRSMADLQETLAAIVAAAVETVPGAAAGGVSLTQDGTVTSQAPTTETVRKLDDLQSSLNEGPCITAITAPPETGLIIADDLGGVDAQRWPHFAPAAVEAGYQAILSTGLLTDRGQRAALNLYATELEVFDVQAQLIAGLFGTQAALLLYGVEEATHLTQALQTRDVIGQAKGILRERFTVSDNEAFQMLVSSSQDTNLKLIDVARWLTGDTDQPQQRS